METKEIENRYEAVLQGVATLCSERLKESKKEDLGKEPAEAQPQESATTRKRYSGAARRRHKKQQQREAGERAVQAVTQQTDAAAISPGSGKQGLSRAVKRSWLDSSIPSPSGEQITKKPKVPEQRTYAQTAAGINRVAIVPKAYPDKRFDEEEVALLKETVTGCILDLVMGTKAPIFQGTSERDGAVIFNCADIETVEWLKSLTTALTIKEGLQLRAVGVDELPKRHRVVVHVEDPKMSVKQILDLLDRQNEGLTSSEWVVVRGSESMDATSAHFAALIGDRPLERLKALNFKPYCGLGQASIKLPAKARRENKDVEGSTEPTK
jgi:hypothetical protein